MSGDLRIFAKRHVWAPCCLLEEWQRRTGDEQSELIRCQEFSRREIEKLVHQDAQQKAIQQEPDLSRKRTTALHLYASPI